MLVFSRWLHIGDMLNNFQVSCPELLAEPKICRMLAALGLVDGFGAKSQNPELTASRREYTPYTDPI